MLTIPTVWAKTRPKFFLYTTTSHLVTVDTSLKSTNLIEKSSRRRAVGGCFWCKCLLCCTLTSVLLMIIPLRILLGLWLSGNSSATSVTDTTTASSTTLANNTGNTSQTATTTDTTTTVTGCPTTNAGNLFNYTGTGPLGWKLYTLTWVATTYQPSLVFSFMISGSRELFLDDVSVADASQAGVNLLRNGDFEISTKVAVEWYDWCGNNCIGSKGYINTGSLCHGKNGNCYANACGTSNVVEFLSQGFPATVGLTYTIKFFLKGTGNGPNIPFAVSIY
ncbi:unnamed protein product [Rotaria socialis]|uniref:Uncharacterized protein n=1 Tax=Rotaria socialis TaxID=392032 RepID=A0A818BGQ9_9BILA|nr:unnamed protein product [Rotaria socialis]CAF3389864.1 unnamed protein product [Rotaria socialis]CAF3414936.1 unnamed protein product [Rotaria socialis]